MPATITAKRRPHNRHVGDAIRLTPTSPATANASAVLDVFESDLGWIAFSAIERRLLGVTFGHARRADALAAAKTHRMIGVSPQTNAAMFSASDLNWIADLRERFQSFSRGEFEDFRDVAVDDSHLTPFERSVAKACRAIPYGQTLSYGQLAAKVGRAGAARAVGRVMATNRYPLVVPCHRVLASGGGLGGYSAPQGLNMKRKLLAMEAGDAPRPLFAK
jgi:methylated-DNA-[protein]-cysteine S-methyltransferase